MIPGSITMLFYCKRKGADNRWRLFCCPKYGVRFGQETLSGINKNHCPDKSIISKSCFKSKSETGNLQGFI